MRRAIEQGEHLLLNPSGIVKCEAGVREQNSRKNFTLLLYVHFPFNVKLHVLGSQQQRRHNLSMRGSRKRPATSKALDNRAKSAEVYQEAARRMEQDGFTAGVESKVDEVRCNISEPHSFITTNSAFYIVENPQLRSRSYRLRILDRSRRNYARSYCWKNNVEQKRRRTKPDR